MRVADIRTYVYGATYDSWNRVQTMTYPDGEVVTYHYNAAGQVESMTSNKQGRQSVIVDRISYDKEGHTVYTKLGNGTETTYTYDKQRERLQVMNLTADGQTVMENRYQYDAVDNILGITNAANPTSLTKLNKAKLGGRSSHTYEYDELNRLIHANGKAKSASYDMVMSFGRMSEPLTKVQKVDSTTTAKSYNFAYKYEDSNHPTAPTQIGHDHYTYDANGNPTLVTNDSTNTTREMYWDEDNRLMVLSDNGKTSRYTYNAAGERIMKSYGTMEGAYGDPENTGVGYNAVLTELGNHDVPQGWIQTPKPNATPNTNPGPPISWNDPSNPDDPQAGYGYIPNDTTKEETFFYHSDHLGSTSYITDDHANITQYDAYLPYGELLVDEHSSTEELPYKFNGKQFDEETGLYYYGARYINPVTSLWYGVDPLAEKYLMTGAYVYCGDNPIVLKDPDGRGWIQTQKGIYYNPKIHSQKDISVRHTRRGFKYLGETYHNAKQGISYRSDGSILFRHESDAYKHMWNQANNLHKVPRNPQGKEVGGFILSNGNVLVLPDYNNDSRTMKISEYGYKIGHHSVSKGNVVYSVVAQIHTHQDTSGDPTPSYYSPNGPYDGKLAENMRIPVFVLGHDNNVTGILQNKKHQAFIEDLPKPFNKVSTFLKANISFFSYVAKNTWSLKE